ncbi:protein of unknown function [Moritella yayanosii]|uniref:Uncharacterized protein n=1 Tax=Moritella yayanosii TaxID=69539 RepID=A0A330LMG3_9GAMM|nr:protein of unknown function [Moritella yayanosii]
MVAKYSQHKLVPPLGREHIAVSSKELKAKSIAFGLFYGIL